jgi:tryptophan-rich sensory protein
MTGASSIRLLICLALCLSVGLLSGSVTSPEIPTWYASLVKPSWTPPNWVFPVVWNILYVMMAVSLWLLWGCTGEPRAIRTAVVLFFLQLALNAIWSPVFFVLHHTKAALVIIAIMAIAIAATIVAAWRPHRIAAMLLVPYLAWVLYAASLNAGIVLLNP